MAVCDYVRGLSKSLLAFASVLSFVSATHKKWCFAGQTLIHDGTDAPQISLGIIGLGRHDLRSLWPEKKKRK